MDHVDLFKTLETDQKIVSRNVSIENGLAIYNPWKELHVEKINEFLNTLEI